MRRDRLKAIRERRGLSQRELSKRCGFGEKEIHRYEKGESLPSSEHVAHIAQELSVTSDYLLGLSDDPLPYSNRGDLTPIMRELLIAFDTGEIAELMLKLLENARSNKGDQASISGKKPTIES